MKSALVLKVMGPGGQGSSKCQKNRKLVCLPSKLNPSCRIHMLHRLKHATRIKAHIYHFHNKIPGCQRGTHKTRSRCLMQGLVLVCGRCCSDRAARPPLRSPRCLGLPGFCCWSCPVQLCALLWDTRSPAGAARPVSVVVVRLALEAATLAPVLARTPHQPVTMAAGRFACGTGIFAE